RNVSKQVGEEAHIRDVSLTLEKGSLNVLLGPTLSGKTSLMRLMAGLGEHFGDGLYAAEIDYLMRCEWAETAEDVLWRRSKLGLHVSEGLKQNLDEAFKRRRLATGRQETA
ncbi:MAG: hypothetical protein RLN99_11630, partial [Kiloniellaceae bacterium]